MNRAKGYEMQSFKTPEIVGPGIYVYDNVLENPQRYIDVALSSNDWRDAKIYADHEGTHALDKNVRNNKILDMPSDFYAPLEWYLITRTIWLYADQYAKEQGFNFSGMEQLAMLHYDKGAGFYNPHIDHSDANPRVAAALLYLNDVEEGGETFFVNFDLGVKPKAGRLVLFPGNYPYLHGAKVPVSGDKFAVVTWFAPAITNEK